MAHARNDRRRRYWGFVSALPAPVVCMVAKQAEEQGLEGVFAEALPQPVHVDPDLPGGGRLALAEA